MKCPESTEPHSTECNKYLKCASLGQVISWITMKCPEGLIYDKNLRSCAIPGDNWECYSESDEESEQDEKNVYGIKNLEISQVEPDANNDDGFLEVINESLNSGDSQVESSFNDDSASGDGEIPDIVTPSSSPTVRMITTQLQRLTQLMQHVKDKNDGVIDDEEVTAEDLNSFLATQEIQSDSSDYQRTNLNLNDKTPMPSNGRIHPDILSNILDRQSQLNSELNELTTLSMDATTPKAILLKPVSYFNRDPITEIQLKSGSNSDGTGSHQIVVNRPEGSVLFNVPSPDNQHHQSPYLSEDILKTILEISKQMVTQNQHQKQEPQVSYAPQPFYYGVPIPIISPQNNAQSYYNHDYRNNATEAASPVLKQKTKPNRVQLVPQPLNEKISPKVDKVYPGYVDSYGYYHHEPSASQEYPAHNIQPNNPQNYQNPNYYYHNYPSYSNGYQNYQPFPQSNYRYPTKNQYSNTQNYNQQYDFDGSYYGNRPLVIESSAPSYVEHSVRPKPFRKESYATSYNNDDEEEKNDENLYDEVDFDDEPEEMPDKKEELICSYVVQRQANKTDCFRYYVCNAKTKEVISYSCPIFTAFNDQTKFCDSLSYSTCKKTKERESSVSQNKRIYDEANKALEKVKKESLKVERIASMVREESQKIYKHRNQFPNDYHQDQTQAFFPQNYIQAQRVQKPLTRQPPVNSPPVRIQRPKPSRKSAKKKKKKVKCRNVGNIVDPESESSYWHCFKGADGRMKRINRQCTSNFVFCPVSRFCSPANRC